MAALAALRGSIPDAAKDIRLNLLAVMRGGVLTDRQRWGVAVASAIAARNPRLRNAVLAAAARVDDDATVDDARAAAALMAMNHRRAPRSAGRAGRRRGLYSRA
ncbi:MAG TPA: hypothetical protein VMT79_10700 [Candidatus Binatia bacterium]|nr:hypothetical protein [Candidatus Binatia bacterium]